MAEMGEEELAASFFGDEEVPSASPYSNNMVLEVKDLVV